MLNAQSGSPAGTVSAACALSSRTMREREGKAHTRTAMRTNVCARGIRRITADLLSRSRRMSAVSCPGGGDGVYQNRQVNRGACRFPPLACGSNVRVAQGGEDFGLALKTRVPIGIS